MPDSAGASSRFYRRLAEGVQRTRLVEPILASRPALVVIGAPSGYGKTVLAAQVAVSGGYEDVHWVDCGGGGSVEDDLARMALLLSPPIVAEPLPDAVDTCSLALSSMADDRPVLMVFDDVGWAADPSALAALLSAIAEAPLGTVTIVTARAAAELPRGPLQAWNLGIEELRLSDSEMGEAWYRLTGVRPDESGVSRLVESSGRHFALLSLLGRNASLMGGVAVPQRCSPSVSSLLKGLVESQLDETETELLHCAAVVGEGGLRELAVLARQSGVRERLTHVSEVIPLVSVSGEDSVERFAVHDLVADALESARALAEATPGILIGAIELLEASGRPTRALEIAVRSRAVDVLADCVERTGPQLLRGCGWKSVCEALGMVPSAAIASRPGLLLVKAEAEWACGRRSEGIRQAEMAIRIEELAASGGSLPRAHALLAGMRMVLADFSGIVSEVSPLMEDEAVRASDEYGEILYAAIAAFGFLGDRAGLTRAIDEAVALIARSQASPFLLSRIDFVRASLFLLLEGDARAATRLSRSAASRDGVPSHWRLSAACNVAAFTLETGDLDRAQIELATAIAVLGDSGAPSDHAIRRLLSETIRGLSGEAVDISAAIETLLECCTAEGEKFTYVFTCVRGVEVALSLREFSYACDLSERGAAQALVTGSPVILWLAELAQAQTSLAAGETDRARETAERLLPRVEAIGAMGHVLHARMILAEVALRAGDFAVAIEHISHVAKHIVDATPGLVVASYVRAFPELLGPLVHVIGPERVPAGVLRCLAGAYADEAFEAAAAVLTKAELSTLKGRMLGMGSCAARSEPPEMTPEVPIEVKLFGGLEVKTARGVVAQRDWGKRKARLLFAMLVARHGIDVHRAEIIDYLWPDLDEAHGVNNFYVVWSAMKRALSPKDSEVETAPPFENHNGVCRVIPARLVSDLDLFTSARTSTRIAREAGDTNAELAALRTAIELYRGDVLPGDIYDDWFGGVRQRFRQEYEAAVVRFAMLAVAGGDPLAAMPFVIEASDRNPLREDLYQVKIRLEVASNQRGAAMGTYMFCRKTLVEELGIDPSKETMDLYQQILAMEDGPDEDAYRVEER